MKVTIVIVFCFTLSFGFRIKDQNQLKQNSFHQHSNFEIKNPKSITLLTDFWRKFALHMRLGLNELLMMGDIPFFGHVSFLEACFPNWLILLVSVFHEHKLLCRKQRVNLNHLDNVCTNRLTHPLTSFMNMFRMLRKSFDHKPKINRDRRKATRMGGKVEEIFNIVYDDIHPVHKFMGIRNCSNATITRRLQKRYFAY